MAKNKISEYSSTAANNTDVANINIAEGCSPSNINNAIRAVMSHLKNFQDGSSGDSLTNAGTLAITGGLTLDGSAGTTGQVLLSAGSGNTPTWGNAFVAGMIMMWSGTIATIPSGWYLCDGNNGTPDLRNRFIIGANADDGGAAKTNVTGSATQSGGSKDAVVVSHTHTGTTDAGSPHKHTGGTRRVHDAADGEYGQISDAGLVALPVARQSGTLSYDLDYTSDESSHTHTFTTGSTGSSATNANLPPFYALAFIQKA